MHFTSRKMNKNLKNILRQKSGLPCTTRCTFVDSGFLFVRMEHTYGPSSYRFTFRIIILYSVTAVFSRTTRGSKDHFSLPVKRMVVRLSHATRETLLSTLHLLKRETTHVKLHVTVWCIRKYTQCNRDADGCGACCLSFPISISEDAQKLND